MLKFIIVLFAVLASVAAKPGVLAPSAYSAPLFATAPGIVTATSNQVIARNYNGIATAPVLAAAPLAVAPAAYATAPLGYASAAPQAVSSLGYASSLNYAAPAQFIL